MPPLLFAHKPTNLSSLPASNALPAALPANAPEPTGKSQIIGYSPAAPPAEHPVPLLQLSVADQGSQQRDLTRRGGAQTERLTGEVAIQRAVLRKTRQPMESIATRSFGVVSLVLMPAKNNADAKRTTPST
jgi:hypothetical protein